MRNHCGHTQTPGAVLRTGSKDTSCSGAVTGRISLRRSLASGWKSALPQACSMSNSISERSSVSATVWPSRFAYLPASVGE